LAQLAFLKISNIIFRLKWAPNCLTQLTAAATSVIAPPTGGPTTKKKSTEIVNVQSKLDMATALSHLASTSHERAAISFLKIGPPKDLGEWIGKVGFSSYKIALLKYYFLACGTVAPGDIWNAMCFCDLPTIGYQVEHFEKLHL